VEPLPDHQRGREGGQFVFYRLLDQKGKKRKIVVAFKKASIAGDAGRKCRHRGRERREFYQGFF